MNLEDIKKIYFVGIGGIGMSALARYFHKDGRDVHGYDRTQTTLTKKLEAEGMLIHYEEDLNKIPEGIDLVVYTPAVPDTHKELQYFRKEGFPVKKRSEVLGIISRSKKTAAVAGTHGKTTTSSMLTHLLRTGGVDCTAFLGGITRNYNSNFLHGQSDWVVVEADEYDRSFLTLDPDYAIILSIDADHLDIYGDRESLLNTGFKAFARKIKPGGKIWMRHDLIDQFSEIDIPKESYGIENGNCQAENIRVENGFFVFDYISPGHQIKGLKLAMAGKHNVSNATVALSVALEIGISEEAVRTALEGFKGIQRRFDIIFRSPKTVYIDDYAHHPEELRAAIDAARQLFPGRKLTGIFQPHLYSRTRDFAEGFAASLDGLDETLLLDIYPAREEPIPGVSSDIIFDKMKNENRLRLTKNELMNALKDLDLDILMTMGAGDIDTFVEPIKNYLTNEPS